MILSDREIQYLIQRKQLLITPLPNLDTYSATAVDILLDAQIHVWKSIAPDKTMGVDPCFCPTENGFNARKKIEEHTEVHDLRKDGPFRFYPMGTSPAAILDKNGKRQKNKGIGFILGWTKQKLLIPHESRIGARVEGKSSLARLGMGVHVTAPTVHAGFGVGEDPEGDALQLEMWNVGPLPIELNYEMKVCQLIFEEVHGTPNNEHESQFKGQGYKPPTSANAKSVKGSRVKK